MRAGSVDEVIEAYRAALAARTDIRDRLRVALHAVERLREEDAEKTRIVRELRDEVRTALDRASNDNGVAA